MERSAELSSDYAQHTISFRFSPRIRNVGPSQRRTLFRVPSCRFTAQPRLGHSSYLVRRGVLAGRGSRQSQAWCHDGEAVSLCSVFVQMECSLAMHLSRHLSLYSLDVGQQQLLGSLVRAEAVVGGTSNRSESKCTLVTQRSWSLPYGQSGQMIAGNTRFQKCIPLTVSWSACYLRVRLRSCGNVSCISGSTKVGYRTPHT